MGCCSAVGPVVAGTPHCSGHGGSFIDLGVARSARVAQQVERLPLSRVEFAPPPHVQEPEPPNEAGGLFGLGLPSLCFGVCVVFLEIPKSDFEWLWVACQDARDVLT